jgi:organic radical activating enzyme
MIIKSLEEMNESVICAQPWFGVQVLADGTCGACCEINAIDKHRNINTTPLADFQKSPLIKHLQTQMLNGIKPVECSKCFKKEEHTKNSLRTSLNQVFFENNKEFDSDVVKLQNIEFVLGNLCQLQCVMCHPTRSKKINGFFEHIINTGMRKTYIHVQTLSPEYNTSWVENPDVWDNIAKDSKDAVRIYINGGEPMLATEHEKVLNRLIESGQSKNVLLVYSTNGLLLTDRHIEKWKHFKSVSVSFSLDDIGERNSFIRYPSNWPNIREALDNVVRWQSENIQSQPGKGIEFGIWCAINVLSFYYLDEFISFFGENYPSIRINGWRQIDTPEYLSPIHLPYDIKVEAANRIKDALNKYPNIKFYDAESTIDQIVKTEDNPELLRDGIAFLKSNAAFHNIDINQSFGEILNKIQ